MLKKNEMIEKAVEMMTNSNRYTNIYRSYQEESRNVTFDLDVTFTFGDKTLFIEDKECFSAIMKVFGSKLLAINEQEDKLAACNFNEKDCDDKLSRIHFIEDLWNQIPEVYENTELKDLYFKLKEELRPMDKVRKEIRDINNKIEYLNRDLYTIMECLSKVCIIIIDDDGLY